MVELFPEGHSLETLACNEATSGPGEVLPSKSLSGLFPR
jgi:hypothetical protein